MTLTKIPFEALQKISRHKPIIKNHIPPKVEEACDPAYKRSAGYGECSLGHYRTQKQGCFICPAGVNACTKTWKSNRLMKMKDLMILTDSKVAASGERDRAE